MVGLARGKGDKHQVVPSKTTFLEERKPLEGQDAAGKQPRPAQRLDTEREVLVPLPAPGLGVHHDTLLRCAVPLLVGRTL